MIRNLNEIVINRNKILRKISKKLSMDLESLDRVIDDIQYKIEKENNVRKCKDGKVVLSFEE